VSRTTLAYLSQDAPGSIRRDGTLSIEPDADVDRTISGVEIQEVATEVRDARSARGSAAPHVARNGFELRHEPTPAIDFLDHAAVVEQYLPRCEELVLDAVGGRQAIAFDYNIRAAERAARGRVLGDRRFVHGPARVVHADFTLDGSRQWIRDLVSGAAPTTVAADERAPVDAAGLDALLDGSTPWRFVTIWRNRSDEPVRDNALAMCDGSSVRAPDLAACEIRYAHRVGEAYFARPAAAHEWWWYPELHRDEVLLIKQWDASGVFARSDGAVSDPDGDGPSTFCLHASFDPFGEDVGHQRESIDVRCLVIG
jgi:hypothetical protein